MKSQIRNILGSESHMVYVTPIQLCHRQYRYEWAWLDANNAIHKTDCVGFHPRAMVTEPLA